MSPLIGIVNPGFEIYLLIFNLKALPSIIPASKMMLPVMLKGTYWSPVLALLNKVADPSPAATAAPGRPVLDR